MENEVERKFTFERENKNLYTTTMIWNLYSDKSVLKLIGEWPSQSVYPPKMFSSFTHPHPVPD